MDAPILARPLFEWHANTIVPTGLYSGSVNAAIPATNPATTKDVLLDIEERLSDMMAKFYGDLQPNQQCALSDLKWVNSFSWASFRDSSDEDPLKSTKALVLQTRAILEFFLPRGAMDPVSNFYRALLRAITKVCRPVRVAQQLALASRYAIGCEVN
jgi:hypothetical protein